MRIPATPTVARAAVALATAAVAVLAVPQLVRAQGATPSLFEPYTLYPISGNEALAVAIGDLTGDGLNDVVVARYAKPPLLYRGNATGGLNAPAAIGTVMGLTGVDIGDLNGDGRLDLVGAAYSGIRVYYQTAAGTLDAPILAAATASGVNLVRVGDLDSDGRADVVATRKGSGVPGVEVFLQTPAGTLAAPASYPVPEIFMNDLALGDVTGDARTDVVVMTNEGLAGFAVLAQNALGTLDVPVYQVVLFGDPDPTRGIAAGDVTGDGRADLVVSYADGRPRPDLNGGWSSMLVYTDPSRVPEDGFSLAATANPEAVVVADMDGDGRKDIIVAHGADQGSNPNLLGVFRQGATGAFLPEVLAPIPRVGHYFAHRLAVGDLNGDGRPDVAIADRDHGLVVLRRKSSPDAPTVAVRSSAWLVEGAAGAFIFERSGPTDAPLAIEYDLGGTATPGQDFPGAAAGTVTIPAGASSAALAVVPALDGAFEGSEYIRIFVRPSAAYMSGVPFVATVSIVDGDKPAVTVRAAAASVVEGGGPAAAFTFARTGPTTSPLTVAIAVGGTAGAGSDYVPLAGSVVFPAGAAEVTLALEPVDDAIDGCGDETVIVTVDPGADHVVGPEAAATVAIADDDVPAVSVVADGPSVPEAGTALGTFRFARAGCLDGALTVLLDIGGSASSGADYVALPATVVFAAGAAEATLSLRSLPDAAAECDETVAVAIRPDAAYVGAAPAGASIAIRDNDRPVVTVSVPDGTAAEPNNQGRFQVTRTGPRTAPLVVRYALSGTATNGADYQALGGTVTIPAGQASAPVVVRPINDSRGEPAETVVLTLSPDPCAYDAGAPASGSVRFLDND